MTQNLPSLNPIPADIADHLPGLIAQEPMPELQAWLVELIENSNHLSNTDDIRWRIVCVVWLATRFDADTAWPYLMWFNQNEPVIQEHFTDFLGEGAAELRCHVDLITWIEQTEDDRLSHFFSDFHHLPPQYKLDRIAENLLTRPTAPETGTWLAHFCRETTGKTTAQLRPWRLLFGGWYAANFDAEAGLAYLRDLTNGADSLAREDYQTLLDLATDLGAVRPLTRWIATATDPALKTMLGDFNHPDLDDLAATRLGDDPDYSHLSHRVNEAPAAAETFRRARALLDEAGIKSGASLLDLACGPLAPQTVLFHTAGYAITGVDLDLPPEYLPLPGWLDWFKRRQHAQAWREASQPYYNLLARHADTGLNWRGLSLKLADPTRLPFAAASFDAILYLDHLPHATDVPGLLAEAARVLRPDGVFIANFRPFPALTGSFREAGEPWSHLRADRHAAFAVNPWSEADYRAALETHFHLDPWLPDPDPQAESLLTEALRAELAAYDPAELTRREVWAVGRLAGRE